MKNSCKILEKIISLIVLFALLLNTFAIDIFAIDTPDENIDISDGVIIEEVEDLSKNSTININIPDNNESLLNDLGFDKGIVTNIEKIQTFSLLNRKQTNDVLMEVDSFNDGESVDVIHFIEDPYYINDDTVIINVSHYSNESKAILNPAIQAYQESFDSEKECVAIEIFEDIVVENNQIAFQTNSFSIFAIGNVALTTYEFYLDDELVNTQYIIGSDVGKGVLLEPSVPEKKHAQFLGWEIGNSGKYQEFGEIAVDTNENITIKCYAKFKNIQYIIFKYEAKEDAYILETLSGEPGEIISTENIDYPLNLDKHVISWHTDVNLTSEPVKEISFLEGEDIILYPNVLEGHWVTFYTDGGSYMEPMFYADDETIVAPSNPTKTGYEFAGWIDENGSTFTFNNQLLNESVVLTAVWSPANTTYYVQIMFERQNSNGIYDAAVGGSFTRQGPTGSIVNGNMSTESERNSAINKLDSENVFKSNLTHYEYNATKSANSTTTVLGNGTSIVYVYYDLKYYTVTFNLGTSTSKRMTIGGKTYTGGSNAEKYTITAKYGDLIADKWPLAEHFEADDNFRRWQYKTGYYWVTKQHYMIGSDLINKTMTANYSSSSTIIAWYLVESLDQTSPEGGSFETKDYRKLYNGVYYDMDPVYTQEVKSTVSQWSTQKPITGYNIVTMVKDSDNACVYMYYSRSRHNLNFYSNGVKLLSVSDIMYGTPLTYVSEAANYINGAIPPLPNDYEEGTYGFAGWYNTEQCYDGTDVDLKTLTIPNQDIDIYAKWVPINVELYVHVTIDGTDTIIDGYNGFTIKYGNKVDRNQVDSLLNAVQMPEGAIWYGWYEKINIGDEVDVLVPFNFNRELIEDLILYPFYSYLEPVHLEYDLNGGTGVAPIDEFSYALGKGAIVMSGEEVVPPENKVFIGWNTKPDGTGKTYYAGDVAIIDINELKLYAMYGDKPKIEDVSLTYVNTISLESISNTYSEFETVSISDTSIFNEYVSKRYIFKEWNIEPDGTGESFNVGDSVILTSDSENILYAIYVESELPILNIPVSKTLIHYNGSEAIKFYFNAILCDEFGVELIPNVMFERFINVTDAENVIENIEISFDESQLVNGNTMYYKIYEVEDSLTPVAYDKSYYIVKIEIISNIPQITNVNKYDEFGNQITEFVYNDELVFLNKYLVDIDALPDTGGNGHDIFVVSGSFFCILGIMCCLIYFKNKKR